MACLNMLSVLLNFGFLVFGVTDFAAPRFSPHYGAICAGEPRSEAEQASCRLLGQRLAEWLAYFIDKKNNQHPMYKLNLKIGE